MSRLDDAARARLRLECWWSHDGQWFLKAREAHGLDAAMALNEDAIESMGRIEMRRLHAELGAPPVEGVADLLPLLIEAHELVGWPARGRVEAPGALIFEVDDCPVWDMTRAAGLEAAAPGCRGALRRQLGWVSVFVPRERIAWTRTHGLPDGDRSCGYRLRLLPG